MRIIKNGLYEIQGKSNYFQKKYGTTNPQFQLEGEDIEVLGQSWQGMNGNPAAMLYGMRCGIEGLPLSGKVYYGHINGLGELVHESELKEANNG